jgi:hypothetical protein
MASLRVLAIVPEPTDAAWSPAAAAAWSSLQQSLRGLVVAGRIELVRLSPASESALNERVERESFHVVHVVGRGSSRPAARHGMLTLEGSDRRARDLNAQNFARACAGIAGLELCVVQPLAAPSELDVLCGALIEQAAPVVLAPAASADGGREMSRRCMALYMSLSSGQWLDEAFAAMAHPALTAPAGCAGSAQARLFRRDPPLRAAAVPPARPEEHTRRADPIVATPIVATPPVGATRVQEERELVAKQQLDSKRAAGAFDVFLCHNVADKPAVLGIAERLMAHGILPWLDQWELRPGLPWQRVLEEQISSIRTAAVFVGSEGIGPWQRQELDGFLREFNQRGCPVIPVMLPGAGGEPELPLFLRAMTWVDFRVAAPDPLSHLLWGITGVRLS